MYKFKKGDKVRVLDGSKIKDYTGGWTIGMSKYVGQVFVVRGTFAVFERVAYGLDTIYYIFDERGLELVNDRVDNERRMKMHKFKNGDKVRVLDGSGIKDYTLGWLKDMKRYVGRVFVVLDAGPFIPGKPCYKLYNVPYIFDERGLELVNDREPKNEVLIKAEGNKVIAKNLISGKTGVAKCSPEDTFDFMIGAKLALERLSVSEKHKFKVGDRVVGNSSANLNYGITKAGWVGTVVGFGNDGYFVGSDLKDPEETYTLAEDCFDLANDRLAPGDIVVIRDSITEAAISNKDAIRILSELTTNAEDLIRFSLDYNYMGLLGAKRRAKRGKVLAADKDFALIKLNDARDSRTYLISAKGLARC